MVITVQELFHELKTSSVFRKEVFEQALINLMSILKIFVKENFDSKEITKSYLGKISLLNHHNCPKFIKH